MCIAASKGPFVKAVTTNYSAKQPTVSIAKATILAENSTLGYQRLVITCDIVFVL